jgi:hypothetical protein
MQKKKINPQVKKINLHVLTNILKESEKVRISNYGEMQAHIVIHPIFGEITVVKTTGDDG